MESTSEDKQVVATNEVATSASNLEIEDADKLFMHVAKAHFKAQGYDFTDIPLMAFDPKGDGNLSVNWSKICLTPEDCLSRASKTKDTHGVGHFIAGEVRKCDLSDEPSLKGTILGVYYSPTNNNNAHSHITGIPSSKPKPPYNRMRVILKGLFKSWDII